MANLSNFNIKLEQNISLFYKMVQYEIEMRSKFGASKNICFQMKEFI